MRNYSLSSMKFFAVVLVVIIHSTTYIYIEGNADFLNYYWYRPLLNISVPFFFSASGYLLSFKEISYFKKYLSKILILYISYSILYYFFELIIFLGQHLLNGQRDLFNLIINFFKEQDFFSFLNGSFGSNHLWYLWALFIGGGLLYWLLKRKIELNQILLISLSTYFISTILREIFFINAILLEGGFLEALAFLSIGFFIGKKDIGATFPLLKAVVVLIIYAILFQVIGFNMYLDLLLILSSWYLCLFIKNNPGEKNWFSILGDESTSIYLNHMFFITSYSILYNLNPSFMINNNLFRVCVVVLFSIIFSIFFQKVLDIIYLKPLGKFILLIKNQLK